MIEFELDYRALRSLRAEYATRWAKSIERAFKAELYRLLGVMRKLTRAGVGPSRAPLTRAESRRRTDRALSYVAQVAAYEFRRSGLDLTGLVGPGAQAARREKSIPTGLLAFSVGPRTLTVTREMQKGIAGKLRRRGADKLLKGVKRARKGGRRGAILPKIGTRLTFADRVYATAIERAEATRSAENIARLTAMALRGERWGRS